MSAHMPPLVLEMVMACGIKASQRISIKVYLKNILQSSSSPSSCQVLLACVFVILLPVNLSVTVVCCMLYVPSIHSVSLTPYTLHGMLAQHASV